MSSVAHLARCEQCSYCVVLCCTLLGFVTVHVVREVSAHVGSFAVRSMLCMQQQKFVAAAFNGGGGCSVVLQCVAAAHHAYPVGCVQMQHCW